MAALTMLGPAIAALVQHRLLDKAPWPELGFHPKHIRWKFMWLTVLAGICIVPVYFAVVALCGNELGLGGFGHVSLTSERFTAAVTQLLGQAEDGGRSSELGAILARIPAGLVLVLMQVSAVFAAFTFNLPFMCGEELGWRGYLYQRTANWGALRRIFLTGIVWGLWHAPFIAMGHNYPGHPVTGIGFMVIFCAVLAFPLDWSRTRSGSMWPACILHGLVNGTAGGAMLFVRGTHPLVGSIAGAAGCMAVLLIMIVILAFDRTYRGKLFSGAASEPHS